MRIAGPICKCGTPASYGSECRNCYESRIRHETTESCERNWEKVDAHISMMKPYVPPEEREIH